MDHSLNLAEIIVSLPADVKTVNHTEKLSLFSFQKFINLAFKSSLLSGIGVYLNEPSCKTNEAMSFLTSATSY